MSDPSSRHQVFHTTRWSLVVRARDRSEEARSALEELCRAYWYPLYAYVRRRGADRDRAADLTQGFFASFVERHDVARVDRDRGRFRSYLLGALEHFMANEHERETALRRGGGTRTLSLDVDAADERYAASLAGEATPEAAFERAWCVALLERVLDRLRAEYRESGRGELFEALEGELAGEERGTTLREIGEGLGMRESAIRVAAHRLRQRYRQRLRDEVAQTVEDPAEIEEELRGLFRALGG